MLKILLSEIIIDIGSEDKLYVQIAIPVWTQVGGIVCGVIAHFIWR